MQDEEFPTPLRANLKPLTPLRQQKKERGTKLSTIPILAPPRSVLNIAFFGKQLTVDKIFPAFLNWSKMFHNCTNFHLPLPSSRHL